MPEVIKINDPKQIDQYLEKIVAILKSGGVIIYPTETIYGLGTSAENESAIKKIFEIKGREENKPLLCLASNKEMVFKYIVELEPDSKGGKLMDEFWPGPLTIICKKNKKISDLLTGGKNGIGFRVSDNYICNRIVEKLGCPLVSTSLNVSGGETLKSPSSVSDDMLRSVDLVIDVGELENELPSTVVSILDNEVKLLREGMVKREKIFQYIG